MQRQGAQSEEEAPPKQSEEARREDTRAWVESTEKAHADLAAATRECEAAGDTHAAHQWVSERLDEGLPTESWKQMVLEREALLRSEREGAQKAAMQVKAELRAVRIAFAGLD